MTNWQWFRLIFRLGGPAAIQRAIGYYSESSGQEVWRTAWVTPPLPWLIYYLAAGLTLILLAKPLARLMAPDAPEGAQDK